MIGASHYFIAFALIFFFFFFTKQTTNELIKKTEQINSENNHQSQLYKK